MEVESSLQDKVLFESVVYCLPGQGVVDNPAGLWEMWGLRTACRSRFWWRILLYLGQLGRL